MKYMDEELEVSSNATRVIKELEQIFREVEQRKNLPSVYAKYCNWLKEVADTDDYEQADFLNQIVDALKSHIVNIYMKENGYFCNPNDTFDRWEKRV